MIRFPSCRLLLARISSALRQLAVGSIVTIALAHGGSPDIAAAQPGAPWPALPTATPLPTVPPTATPNGTPTAVPVMLTYRSGALSSRLAVEGAELRAAEQQDIVVTKVDLDAEGTNLPVVRRMLSDSKTKIVLALEPTIDVAFPPMIDSLGLTVIATSFLEGAITPATKGLFSVYPRIDGIREAVERFFIAQPTIKNFSIICSNSRIGLRYSEVWDEVGRKRGVTIPRASCGNEQSFDFRIAMLRAKGQRMDGFGVGFGVLSVVQRLTDMAWPRPLLLTALQGEQLTFDSSQDRSTLNDIFFDAPVFSELFSRAFAQRYDGRQPTISNALGYEALTALSKALALGGDPVASLRKLSYDGVSGVMDFTIENTGNSAKSVLMHFEGPTAVRMH